MSVIGKIKQKFLESSGSYKHYKNENEILNKKFNKEIKSLNKKISRLEKKNEYYE